MSDPDLRLVDEDEEPEGCLAQVSALGLAAYAMLLLTIVCFGIIGILGSTWVMLTGMVKDPSELVAGVEVDQWRMTELRMWGVLPPDVTPDLYHDHSELGDSTAGCMVIDGVVIEWADSARLGEVALADAEMTTTGPDDAPTVRLSAGGVDVTCPFGPGEGGDRFVGMLRAETRSAP